MVKMVSRLLHLTRPHFKDYVHKARFRLRLRKTGNQIPLEDIITAINIDLSIILAKK